jgi:metal-responsive CopG/Arc/MetJ family transcriptional regulator
MKKETRTQYSVMLRPSLVKQIDEIRMNKMCFSRSNFLEQLIHYGLEDMYRLEKLGLASLIYLNLNVYKKLKDEIISGNINIDETGNLIIRK